MEHQQIIFSNDIKEAIGTSLKAFDYNKVVILTDVNTQQLALPKVADVPVIAQSPCITIKSGDTNKNIEAAIAVWKQLETIGATRPL